MLKLREANSIIENALARATELQTPPLAVVVLDAGGHVVAAQRQDGASMFRLDIAHGKAWGAVAMGVSSRALARRAEARPRFFTALSSTAHGRLLPHPGAALIRDAEGAILGAAGASGATGDQDEACCVHGIERVGLIADASE